MRNRMYRKVLVLGIIVIILCSAIFPGISSKKFNPESDKIVNQETSKIEDEVATLTFKGIKDFVFQYLKHIDFLTKSQNNCNIPSSHYVIRRKNKIKGGDKTTEYDIGKQVEKYWDIFKRQLNDEDAKKLDRLLETIEEHFINPAQDNPVKAVDFVRWFNPESILDVLKPSYPYFKYIYDRLIPRMRFFAYFMVSRRKNVWQAYHSLNEEEYFKLGFTDKPTYEILREFCYERIGVEQFPVVLSWLVRELVFLLEKQGIYLGRDTFEDATGVRSLKDDPEAKYSGYYKHEGYKLDYTIDALYTVPLSYIPMEITSDEGRNLIASQEHLVSLGIKERLRVVDDKYATFKNIAHSEINGVSLYYKIAKSWNFKQEGTPGEIRRLYQSYHQCDDFKVDADLDFMLVFLYRRKEYKPVGSYFRNMRMAEYEEHPEGYMDICNERGGRMEGDIGRVKLTTLLDDHPGRRGWKQFMLRAGMTMLSLVFAALIRVQNGVYSDFTNVTYIV